MTTPRRERDGFTLVETVVVVALLGLVAAVIAAVFVTIARTTPVSEDRADDARSLLGLTTWLPQDVGSASPSGFVVGDHTTACGAGVDASQGLLQVSWQEGGATFVADYRFVIQSGGLGRIVRYACRPGEPADSNVVTSPLSPVPASAAPPLPSEFPAPVDLTMFGSPGDYRGVKFDVIVLDDDGSSLRSLLSLDAYTANVMTTLPPPTTVGGTTTTTIPNAVPFAADLYVELPLDSPLTVSLPALDADGDPLSVTITEIDPELTLSIPATGLDVDLEAISGSGAVDGGSYHFHYTVSDGTDVSNEAEVIVEVDNGAVPPATTTSTSTTSTTTVPCSASIVSVSPSSIGVKASGHLDDDVVVTIAASGNCIPLVLSFDPDPTDTDTTPEQLAFGATNAVTIGKNDYVWHASGAPPWGFTLELREGANGDPPGTAEDLATLVVGS